jgi:hypothetical protein
MYDTVAYMNPANTIEQLKMLPHNNSVLVKSDLVLSSAIAVKGNIALGKEVGPDQPTGVFPEGPPEGPPEPKGGFGPPLGGMLYSGLSSLLLFLSLFLSLSLSLSSSEPTDLYTYTTALAVRARFKAAWLARTALPKKRPLITIMIITVCATLLRREEIAEPYFNAQ